MEFDEQSAAKREELFVRAFIVPEKRERYLEFLKKPKRRGEILGRMYHMLDVIPARMLPVANRDQSPDAVESCLRQKGAGKTCYAISPNDALDRKEFLLREALERLTAEDGVAVLCCLPGRLAYYKAEAGQYVLTNSAEGLY